jgi:hypothetical protein
MILGPAVGTGLAHVEPEVRIEAAEHADSTESISTGPPGNPQTSRPFGPFVPQSAAARRR